MVSDLRAHLTYANVMATVAIFVALGGSSYAAITLTKNSVKSKHIAKGAVKRSDIGKGAVNSAKVADFSLLAKDFKGGQLPAGPKGDKGDTGAQGERGPAGQDATKLFAYILDGGASSAATVHYGDGVTAVVDPDGDNTSYTVTFERSLENCVVLANSGKGNPQGGAAGGAAFMHVFMGPGTGGQVGVDAFDAAGARKDTSFLVAAFC